ncbi:hypothetical protein GCM10010529_24750 [Nesterenkonia aethiopica]|uniref:DNA-directed DNA polymerase n=1 Tax=Nesterenkonia aethiopica TaxID=269144 RepID=A0ABP6M158_9MICC
MCPTQTVRFFTVSTALYRRYRPDTFADVIGQEHVTAPLVTALGKDAVSHAYLFSGPRGCGKTTSARILARCLNCAEGPTGTPCGHCESCRDLATGGPGSLDVIEIDAASHGGVDDARDLRERATFAPVRDRYKIFIIDEAHMVTAAGFNALLKIVEEPPEHIKFIFATTEPDKVIGTIRSRTHHYPFRLVPPEPLLDYLQRLCEQERVPVAHGVLPLVIRAGGGSVRDTLSVLDQLIAGSTEAGLDYDRAVALLGFTHSALLDDVVDAVAGLDGSTAFSVVDRVVQSGQDPRRFVEDLLERLRDLIIVKSVPDSPGSILRGVPDDQIRRMQAQAGKVGSAELSRAADITAQALTDMVGATSPRLHLELLMARLLLPHADQGTSSLAARLERLERRVDFVSGSGATPPAEDPTQTAAQPTSAAPPASETVPAPTSAPPSGQAPAPVPSSVSEAPAQAPAAEPLAASNPAAAAAPAAASAPAADDDGWATPGVPRPGAESSRFAEAPAAQTIRPEGPTEEAAAPADVPSAAPGATPSAEPTPTEAEPTAPGPTAPGPTAPGPADSAPPHAPANPAAPQGTAPSGSRAEMMRRAWPEIVQQLASQSRLLWMLVKDNASVAGFDGQTLTIAFTNDGARSTFANRRGDQALNAAIQQVLGLQVSFDLITGGAPPAAGQSPKGPSRPTPAPSAQPDPAPAGSDGSSLPREQHPPQPGTWSSHAQTTPPAAEAPARPAPVEAGPASPTGHESDGAPAWMAEETPEPYDADPEPPQAPPSPHPAWNGQPSGDPAGSALSADSPSEAGAATDPVELTDPTYGPTTARVPSVETPGMEASDIDVSRAQTPAPYPLPDLTPQPGPQSEQSSDPTSAEESATKPRVPVFARPSSSRPGSSRTPAPGAPAAEAVGPASAAPRAERNGAPSGTSPGASGRIAAIKERMAKRAAGAEPPGWDDAPPPPDPLYDQGPPPGAAPGAGAGPRSEAGTGAAPAPEIEDIPSDDDITVEESTVFGRKAIERVLDGTLLEERRLGEGPQ